MSYGLTQTSNARVISAALLVHAKTLVAAAGYRVATVSVFAENTNAVKFYLSQNWTLSGNTKPYELVPGIILNIMTLTEEPSTN
jgi:hypothetical protein